MRHSSYDHTARRTPVTEASRAHDPESLHGARLGSAARRHPAPRGEPQTRAGTRLCRAHRRRPRGCLHPDRSLDLRAAARSSTRPPPLAVRDVPVRSEERRETPFQTMASIARVGLHLGGAGPRVRDGLVPAKPGLGPCGARARLDDEQPEPHRGRSMKRRLERTRVGSRQKLDTAAAFGGSRTWSLT